MDATANGTGPPLFIGVNLPARYGATNQEVVNNALEQGYDMITARITSRSYRKRIQSLFDELERAGSLCSNNTPRHSPSPDAGLFSQTHNRDSTGTNGGANAGTNGERHSSAESLFEAEVPMPELDDVVMLPGPHISNTIALASPWVELDSKNSRIANLSLQVLNHELSYASFCGTPYVVVSGPKRRNSLAQYAQALDSLLKLCPDMQLVVHLPFTEEFTTTADGQLEPPADCLSIWEVWHTIRTMCSYPRNLSVALQLPKHTHALPPAVISRWFAEPVAMIVVSARKFVANPKGYPVLPKASQQLLHLYFKKRPFVIVEDPHDTEFQGGDTAFMVYLRHLYQSAPPPKPIEAFSQGFHDFLQIPLQPLVDDLDSPTYEVFERDTVKYNQYEKAIFHALLDRPHKEVVIAVVGAGRGPLVDRALAAAHAANRSVKVYALDKNSAAYVYLLQRQRIEWGSAVEVFCGDMRDWRPPDKVNIVVSELLGSFGDNELSPECIDGVQAILDSADGICIPASYTSYLTPVCAPKLWAEAWSRRSNMAGSSAGGGGVHAETKSPKAVKSALRLEGPDVGAMHAPYVVMMQQVDLVSKDVLPAWRFDHPNYATLCKNAHNTRKFKGTFHVDLKAAVHGFAGYFEAVLYKDITLSIKPGSETDGMVSWFPIWFPLAQPLNLVDACDLDVSFWRATDGRRVWYEWVAESHLTVSRSAATKRIRLASTPLHNSGGVYSSMTL